jgi:hypothetical protein
MYKVNDKVTIVKTGEVKQIIDFETVCGVEVYYMSDKTAYPIDDIIFLDKLEENTIDGRPIKNLATYLIDKLSADDSDPSIIDLKQSLVEDKHGISVKTLKILEEKIIVDYLTSDESLLELQKLMDDSLK